MLISLLMIKNVIFVVGLLLYVLLIVLPDLDPLWSNLHTSCLKTINFNLNDSQFRYKITRKNSSGAEITRK